MRTTTSTVEERLAQTQIASDDDPTSSSGSSSSESESENDSSDEESEDLTRETQSANPADDSSIPNVTGRQKPLIRRVEGGSDLLARLSAFVPKLKNANEDLEKEIAAGRGQDLMVDSVEEGDGKDYIEMVCFSCLLAGQDNTDLSRISGWVYWKRSAMVMILAAVGMTLKAPRKRTIWATWIFSESLWATVSLEINRPLRKWQSEMAGATAEKKHLVDLPCTKYRHLEVHVSID